MSKKSQKIYKKYTNLILICHNLICYTFRARENIMINTEHLDVDTKTTLDAIMNSSATGLQDLIEFLKDFETKKIYRTKHIKVLLGKSSEKNILGDSYTPTIKIETDKSFFRVTCLVNKNNQNFDVVKSKTLTVHQNKALLLETAGKQKNMCSFKIKRNIKSVKNLDENKTKIN